MSGTGGTGGVVAAVTGLVQPIAEQHGLVVWDVRFVKEGAGWVLRVLIDRPDAPVSIDDCVAVSRALSPVLDERDPIEQSYTLEVSSPGVERELTRPAHFEYCMGWQVRVRLYQPFEGCREFTGVLTGYGEDGITLEDDQRTMTFAPNEVAAVRVVDDWEEPSGDMDD